MNFIIAKKPGDKNIKCIKLTEVEEIVFNAKKKNTKAILIRDSKKDNTIIFSTEREALEWYKAIVLAR